MSEENMVRAQRLAVLALASVLLATAPLARAAPPTSPPAARGRADSQPWGAVMAGVQSADGLGGELSVLWFDSKGSVVERGYGVVAGGTRGSAYVEAEAVLTVTPRASGAPDIWIFKTFLTASAGPVVRWTDGALGLQATVSAAVMFVPLIVFVRPRMFFGGPGGDLLAGVMFKVPIWGPD